MEVDEKTIAVLEEKAWHLREKIIRMIGAAGSGHPGGSLSAVEIVTALYFHLMNHDPKNPDWPERDRFVLCKGHAAPVLYAALAEAGYFDPSELDGLRKFGSILQGHPDRKKTPGVEVSTGSLGQGLSIANGIALAGKLDGSDWRVFALLGDGEIQEGQVWEAAMTAAHRSLDNLVAYVDNNNLQIDGDIRNVKGLDNIPARWEAFGWHVQEIDGHDLAAIIEATEKALATKGKPSVIVCRTVKGKGVSFMENQAGWHGKAPNKEQVAEALKQLAQRRDG
ncbi:MAG: transketolase [Firmicutes bacterium]|nr:transketolase [Bacillota bacterium]